MKNSEVLVLGAVALLITMQTKDNFVNGIRWQFKGVQLDGLGFDGSFRFIVLLEIQNNTGTPITFEGFNGKLNYLNQYLTSVKSDIDRVEIKEALTTLRFNVPISIKNIETVFGVTWSEFISNFLNIIRPRNYSLHGELYLRIGGLRYTHQINENLVYS